MFPFRVVCDARRATAGVVAAASLLVLAACVRQPDTGFSVDSARAHVQMLGETIGIRPVGTDANRRAREYLISELTRYGFAVHVQEADAVRPEIGRTAHVFNIVAVKPGALPEAVAIVSHYDSVPTGPGAADAGLGVAVALEAGRVLAADRDRRHTLVIALTDAEEAGLMGAAALVSEPAWRQVRVFLNLEAVGTCGPSALFETGPGNTWLVQVWARSAPAPYGASYATEIYKRLPNDTDFTILKRTRTPGLNFAPIGNSYAYHTHLDTPERLADDTLRQTGDGVVAIVRALERADLNRRTADWTLYFDLGGFGAVAAGSWLAGTLGGLGLVVGCAALVRLLLAVRRRCGLRNLLVTLVVAATGTIAAAGLMVSSAWALRSVRDVYHPWYAHPTRFFALLAVAATLGGWLVTRPATRLPARFRGCADPAASWCAVLLVWIVCGIATGAWLPAASYLVTLPLAASGVALLIVGGSRPSMVRVASLAPMAAAFVLWLRPAWSILHFAVPNLGRQGVITPIYIYPALMLVASVGLVLPVTAATAGWSRRLGRTGAITTVLVAGWLALLIVTTVTPAYTNERPLLAVARYIEDQTTGTAFYETAANEATVVVPRGPGAPEGWQKAVGPAQVSYPLTPLGAPFVYRASVTPTGQAVASVESKIEESATDGVVTVTVVPSKAWATVVLSMPVGVQPIESSVAGVVRGRHWQASYIAPPQGRAVFRLRLRPRDLPSLSVARVMVQVAGLPGGGDLPGLPPWLPRDQIAWSARSIFVLGIAGTP